MKGKIFIDTNILIYAQFSQDSIKQLKCREVLTNLYNENTLVISTQVMQEFYNIATTKLGIDKLHVKKTLELFKFYEIVTLHPSIIFQAIDIQIINQLSFWDSLIISAAKSSECVMLLTEEMKNGQFIEGIKVQSPFTW